MKARVLITAVLLIVFNNSHADWMPVPPFGYDNYLTYIANGVWDPNEPNPTIDNCNGGVCFDDVFATDIQGRNPSEEAMVESAAKNFFNWRYGINLDDPDTASEVLFSAWTFDPRLAYRAYVVSGRYTPPWGYEVRDGGYILITNTERTLGGEFAGVVVPAGTILLFGEYNIAVKRRGKIVREIDISYRSGQPIVPDINGNIAASCDLHRGRILRNNFGDESVARQGLAQIFNGPPLELPDGRLKANTRNAITFSDIGGGY